MSWEVFTGVLPLIMPSPRCNTQYANYLNYPIRSFLPRDEALADNLLVAATPRGWPAQCRHQARRCPYSARTMMETFRAAHARLERAQARLLTLRSDTA